MTVFSKIKKALETESMCTISKEGVPLYAVMTWERYRELSEKTEKLAEAQRTLEEETKEGEYDIDINKIPL